MDACRMHPDGVVTWHGKAAVRVEVDPKDDPLNLGENTERSEMAFLQDATGTQINETSASGVVYYATSYYLPLSWSGTNYPWSVFERGGSTWPGNQSTNCAANNGIDCSSWSLIMQFYGWGVLSAASTDVGVPERLYFDLGTQRLDLGAAALGAWTDLVFRIDWGAGDLTIWRRDQAQPQFAQATHAVGAAPTAAIYEKQGLYRGGTVNGRVDVLWIGPSARGASFAAVEHSAFGTSVGP
jgi:hypothetical protein